MAERELIGLAGLAVFLALLALRAPVGLAMLLVGISGSYALSLAAPFLRFEPYLLGFKTLSWSTLASYELSVVPLFVLMGALAGRANLGRDLFEGLSALAGRLRGGVAIAAIGACAGFGAVCGSSLATASTMARVALPELARLGYGRRLATGTLAAGGTLGILIPPSTPLVIYALIVEASIVELFQAALLPGLLAVAGFVAVVAVAVRLNPALAPAPAPTPPHARRAALRRLVPVAAIFGTIVLGLGLGLFTPTPAAAVGAGLILVYGLATRRAGEGLSARAVGEAFLDTAVTAGMISFILVGAEALKGFFTRSNLPQALSDFVVASGWSPWVVLAAMLVALILLGCVMDSLAMILVVLPFLWPALVAVNGGPEVTADAAGFGLDAEALKIWFGVLALVVVELGLITPPVGLNVFLIGAVSGAPQAEVFRGAAPFFGIELLRVGLLVAVPALSLWLPSAL